MLGVLYNGTQHCNITLFIVTIVEVHVLIYDDFVCYWSFTFCIFNWFYTSVDNALQSYTANVLAQHKH